MSESERNLVAEVFGGDEKVVGRIVETIISLCRVRGWDSTTLAMRAFPSTARQALDPVGVPRAVQEFDHIKRVAEVIVAEPQARRLPAQRFVLAFLDALEAPLEKVLASGLSEEDRKRWIEWLKERRVAAVGSATGRFSPDPESLELLLALNALASVCEPEPAPTDEELQRRHQTRAKVRAILDLPLGQ